MGFFERLTMWFYGLFVPGWDKATLASCWSGSNAGMRNMNILAPGMSDATFKERIKWMKGRGCNTAHVFLSNQGDGQYAGYCPYGTGWTWKVDEAVCKMMRQRIRALRRARLAVVVWLFADDSSAWNAEASKNFVKYLSDCKDQGLLALASSLVVGLELNEYFNSSQVRVLVEVARRFYKGKIGTHQTSGRSDFAAHADLCFYQVSPGKDEAAIASETRRVRAAVGKPLNFFELERHEDRELAQAALSNGAYGVGNW